MTTRRNILKGGAGLAAILATGKAPAYIVKSMLAARKSFCISEGNKEEEMYKDILEAMIRNTSGFSVDLSGVFPFDGETVGFGVNGYMASGQIFRYNKFTEINMGNLKLINSYGFSSSTLRKVICGFIGNNETIFNGCAVLSDVYARVQTSTSLISQTAIFKASPTAQNKQIAWHCGADGKVIKWNAETGQWSVSDDAAQNGGGYNLICVWRAHTRSSRPSSRFWRAAA